MLAVVPLLGTAIILAIAIILILTIVFIAVIYGRYTKKLTKEYQDALALSAEIGNETLSSIRLIKSFFGENYEKRDYEKAIDYAYTKGKAKAQAYGIFMALLGMISNLSILVVISYGAFLVHSDDLNVGQLISFVLYTTYIALGLSEFSGLYRLEQNLTLTCIFI